VGQIDSRSTQGILGDAGIRFKAGKVDTSLESLNAERCQWGRTLLPRTPNGKSGDGSGSIRVLAAVQNARAGQRAPQFAMAGVQRAHSLSQTPVPGGTALGALISGPQGQ
jgi:hypothetical protein